MKLCLSCHSPKIEGTTDYCGTCGHARRKAEREAMKPKKVAKPIRKASPKRQAQLDVYNQLVKVWKKGHLCEVRGCKEMCDDIHHKMGREGELLLKSEYWLRVCRKHHTQITIDSAWAIKNNYSISRNKV